MTKPSPEKTGRKQDGRFAKGASGNPAGKPAGARHQTTIAAEKLMQGDSEAILRAVIEKAKAGDMVAARIVLDRMVPVRKGAPVNVNLPSVKTAVDIAHAVDVLLDEMAAGNLTPDETAIIAGVLDARRRSIETTEFETRLSALEAQAIKSGEPQ
jgi:Family of unknown function (DUF5681)